MRYPLNFPVVLQILGRIFLISLYLVSQASASDCASVGAIRWDAWHGKLHGAVGGVVESTLSPQEFRFRSPFCSSVSETGFLEIDCSDQGVMDKEILYAADGGLSFWGFVKYPEGNSMGISLQRYMVSQYKNLVNFSFILTPKSFSDKRYSQSDYYRILSEFSARDNYQKVLGGRPIFFFLPEGDFFKDEANFKWISGEVVNFKTVFENAGQKSPYFVLMYPNPIVGARLVKMLGFDALSSYAVYGNGKGASYDDLRGLAYEFWDRAKNGGAQVVPIVMAGWDRRPRVVNPVPWEQGYKMRDDEISYYYAQPKPDQLARHTVEAIRWVKENSYASEANAVLVYAWNENDEGGWLIPTQEEGDARVHALGAAITAECKQKN